MTEAWELGIAEASVLLRRRELSAAELVESVIGRLEATEDSVHAWAYVDQQGARNEALAADNSARRGEFLGPLHGIPLGVKDVIDVRGMPAEGGSLALKGRVASDDAGVVRHLRRNGAVILGKTVTHEFAFGQGTPPSKNPWGAVRYAGGSSVGSGVAVAVGSASGTLGTDTGGSVRNPASVNGLVGLKATAGLIDGSGVLNVSHTLDHIGPITRSVADCASMLQGMVGPDSARALPEEWAPPEEMPALTRVAVDRGAWAEWGVTRDVAAVLERAVLTLEELGVEIVELPLPELKMALPASLAISLSESVEHHRELLGRSAERYLQGTRVMIETGALIPVKDVQLARQVRTYLRSFLRSAMENAGIQALVSPTLPSIAPIEADMSHSLTGSTGQDSLSSALMMLSPANLTGMPGLSIPCGFAGGQPVGMHFLGREFTESALLRIAHVYERHTSWHAKVPVRDIVLAENA
ncbi:amidase [Arthrobacter sp. MMS18-M83]|uniref:amidase n=1 Tax=Arthrobacter sp. MMS18-M83 TaxID=2996261 RepID=UPI00227AE860|nr:amidase [Arthrobacter sp. MMS18-M83]WAH99117.1 amidase [Arthrobacter sp. MMS18-M83]